MKDFIQYNEALALKELGFDEECFAKYYQQDGNTPFIQIGESEIEEAESAGDDVTFECDAPLYQQAFKWFRDVHKIHGLIEVNWEKGKGVDFYICTLVSDEHYSDGDLNLFKTYEEAELACLRKLIEIVKTK